jgi:hypothetical protein
MVEDMRDCVRRELMDTNRRCREQHEENELKRKEINELKRNLNDELREKESFVASNEELRAKLRVSENEKTDISRLLDEARQKIAGSFFVNGCLAIQKSHRCLLLNLKFWKNKRMQFLKILQIFATI